MTRTRVRAGAFALCGILLAIVGAPHHRAMGAGSSVPPPATGAPPAARPPNIVFILADDHGWQATSAYAGENERSPPATPGIDRIAREGMRFDRFFVENAICAPSRAAFLTGCFSSRHGVPTNAERFDAAQPTWPGLLGAAGWNTALVGKWHLKSPPTCFGRWEVLIDQGPYYDPVFETPAGRVRREGYTTDLITEQAIAWLRELAREDAPFALCVWHKAPHRNWMPAPRHLGLLEEGDVPEPPTLLDDFAGRSPASRQQRMSIRRDLTPHDLKVDDRQPVGAGSRDAWDAAYAARREAYESRWRADHEGDRSDEWVRWAYQQYAKDYLRCVRGVDESVAAILDELDRLGLAGDTLVVYSSDQGWFLGEHGWYDKRWMYEESFRTPFLVRWPGVVPPGSTTSALCQNIDLAPTILELAGAAVPQRIHGRSLLPILRGGGAAPPNWRDAVYYRYYEGGPRATHAVPVHDGVRTERWKLVFFPELPDGPAWELYDLETDPDETISRADDAALAPVRAELEARLDALRREYGE